MKNQPRLHLAATCAALALGLAGTSPPAGAQAEEELRVIEEVVVVAPRLVRHTERTSTGSTIERVTLTRRVSVRDLDLTRHADVMELEERVNATAREACDYLAEMFPLASPDTPDCVSRAVDDAMEQAEEAIALANR